MKIAHIINVTEINEAKKASYLHIAQPLTIKSMVIAQKTVGTAIDVDLIAVKHKDEYVSLPPEFNRVSDIKKHAWEHIEALRNEIPRKPLPRLKDIILSLYHSSDAEYFIYTNVDIGLLPHFYLEVKDLIKKGYDAFCINRRDLPKKHKGLLLDESNTELIFSLDGVPHWGIDCFVFRRRIVPLLELGNVYIGYPPIGLVLKTQIEANSENFMWFKDKKLTFHIGSEHAWKRDSYWIENRKQAKGLFVYPK